MAPPSRRRLLVSCGTTALVVLGGCTAGTGSTGTTTEPPTDTETTTEAPETATTVPPSAVTAFEDLGETAQSVFEDAYYQGYVERAVDRIPAALQEQPYVRYQGDVYEVRRVTVTGAVAEYTLYAAVVDEGSVAEESLVDYADLSSDAQAAFEQAVADGQFTVRDGSLPGRLDEVGVVKFEGRYYELTVTVGDIPIWKLAVREVG